MTVLAHTTFRITAFCVALLLLAAGTAAQDLPAKIRGYKVHKQEIAVSSSLDPRQTADARVKVGDPELVDISITGVTFALPAELTAIGQSGTVDMITFHDFRVNGIPVSVSEYNTSFTFKKDELVVLPEPAQIFLPAPRIIQAGLAEARDSKDVWIVTGRIFVFGKFRKMGFNFKRVVPVDIDIEIKNPIRPLFAAKPADDDLRDKN